jgi:hypothetical protein
VKYWWEETESNLSDETEWIPVVAALTDQTLENEIELMATYVGEQVKCVEWVVFASADCAVVIAWVCLTVVTAWVCLTVVSPHSSESSNVSSDISTLDYVKNKIAEVLRDDNNQEQKTVHPQQQLVFVILFL